MISDNDYGWFSIDETKIIFYISSSSGESDEIAEGIFAVTNILGKVLPSYVDVLISLKRRPEAGVIKLVSTLLDKDNPIDRMSDHMGPMAVKWFPLSKIILHTYHALYGFEEQ